MGAPDIGQSCVGCLTYEWDIPGDLEDLGFRKQEFVCWGKIPSGGGGVETEERQGPWSCERHGIEGAKNEPARETEEGPSGRWEENGRL